VKASKAVMLTNGWTSSRAKSSDTPQIIFSSENYTVRQKCTAAMFMALSPKIIKALHCS